MSTLTTLTAALRQDLHDQDAAAYRWTDAELARHIQRAIERYQDAQPQDKTKDLAALAETYVYALTGADAIADLINIERVEYPQGENPPVYIPWELRDTNLRLSPSEPPVASTTIRVHYAAAHLVGAASTIPLPHEHIVLTGAAGFAALAWASYAVNRVNVSSATQKEYEQFAYRRSQEFYRELDTLRRDRTQRAGSTVAISGYEI